MFFLLLPVGVNYRTERLPVVTFSLMGICVLVHIWSMVLFFSGINAYERWIETFWFVPARFSWFTVFTSMFVHEGIFHLVGNMVYLFLFGASTEDMLGRWRFLGLYLLGGIVAVFLHVAVTPGHFMSDIPLGGASGAISAAMGGFLLLFPKLTIEFKYFGLFFFRPFGGEFMMRAWIVMSFWFLSDLFWAVLGMVRDSEGSGTAFGAHVGGFAFGLAFLGLMKLWWSKHPRQPYGSEEQEAPVVRRVIPHARVVTESQDPTPIDRPFLIHQNGEQYGPYSLEEIERYVNEGSVRPEAVYWANGMTEWRPLSELLGRPISTT